MKHASEVCRRQLRDVCQPRQHVGLGVVSRQVLDGTSHPKIQAFSCLVGSVCADEKNNEVVMLGEKSFSLYRMDKDPENPDKLIKKDVKEFTFEN